MPQDKLSPIPPQSPGFMTVNYRQKLYAFLQNQEVPGWGSPISPDRLQCLAPDRAALETWWNRHETLTHGVASSSDRLNLPQQQPQQPIARHPISGQTYPLQPLTPSEPEFSEMLTEVLTESLQRTLSALCSDWVMAKNRHFCPLLAETDPCRFSHPCGLPDRSRNG